MPETYAYTADRQARLVMSGWLGNYVIYGSTGGKIYAERWARRGGFIGLFQTYGWVAATAESVGVVTLASVGEIRSEVDRFHDDLVDQVGTT